METKDTEQKYLSICQQLGDVEVVLATYKGIKNNLLIEAGKLQKEMRDSKSNIKVVNNIESL